MRHTREITGQIGGLNRFQAYLEGQKKISQGPNLLADAGDTFFSALRLNPSRKVEAIERARLIADAYQTMSLDATLC